MKFIHPSLYLEIDTEDLELSKKIKKLEEKYNKIPNTKCMACPNKDKVEADCCKMFSPPMLLIEFLNILKNIESNFSKEQKGEIVKKCIDSVLNPDLIKPCVLLDETKCLIYGQRPFSCRMFGVYSPKEWNDRLKNISIELGMKPEEVPFYKQCKGMKIEGKKKFISKKDSDNIFENINNIDVDLYDDYETGKKIVFGLTATYMPFDSHYLSLILGPSNLEQLINMKLVLRNSKDKDSLEYIKTKKQVEDFSKELKGMI